MAVLVMDLTTSPKPEIKFVINKPPVDVQA